MQQFRGLGEAPVTPPPSAPYYDEFFVYLYEVSLTAGQELIDQSVAIDADSDFHWLKLAGHSTGDYEIRFRLPSGRYTSSSRIKNDNIIGTAQFPVPVFPSVRCPGGSRIGVDIKDLSSAANDVVVCFIGHRRFAVR